MKCNNCYSNNTIKNGKQKGKQRYKCKNCGKTFIVDKYVKTERTIAYKGENYQHKRFITIGKIKLSKSSIIYWSISLLFLYSSFSLLFEKEISSFFISIIISAILFGIGFKKSEFIKKDADNTLPPTINPSTKITDKPILTPTIETNSIQTVSNATPGTTTRNITLQELKFETVLKRYLETYHSRIPSEYNFINYFETEFQCILNGIPKHNINISEGNVKRNKEIGLCAEYSQLRKNTNIHSIKDFISIDVETTGLSTGGGDIIEVSAIKWIDFKPVSIFTTLCKPRKAIPIEATRVNKITDDMVASAPSFKQIVSDLENFIGGLPIVAHNASFDLKFLYVCGMESVKDSEAYDTLNLSRNIVRDYNGEKLEDYKLKTVCSEVNIYFADAHRSSTDSLAVGLLFLELVKIKKESESVLDLLDATINAT